MSSNAAGGKSRKAIRLDARVFRTQYAVGHGGFHGGRLFVRTNDHPMPELLLLDGEGAPGTNQLKPVLVKTYVYDCGSESPKAFDRALRSHDRIGGGQTDILFVSHLDSDHVNKIDRLLGSAPAKVVVLPYLASEDLAALLLHDVDAGAVTGSMREYVSDPLGWWQRHGVETVIFVEGGSGDDQPPRGYDPDWPLDPDSPPPASGAEGPQARLAAVIRKPHGKPQRIF
jgi:hypothetical protein